MENNKFEKNIEHQILKSGKKLYSFPKHQMNHNKNEHFDIEYSPYNAYASTLFATGGYIDFKHDLNNEFVYNDLTLSLKLTENNTSSVTLIPGPFWIDNNDILVNGVTTFQYGSHVQYFMNCLNVDKNSSKKHLLDDCGILSSDFRAGVSMLQNTSRTFHIKLHTLLSNLHFYRPKINGDCVIRITFTKDITTTNISDQLIVSDIKLRINATKISQKLQLHYMRSAGYDKKFNQFIFRSYVLSNGITSGVQENIKILGYNYHTSLVIFWISKINDTKANVTKAYGVSSFYLTDANNQNMLNNVNYDTSYVQNQLLQRFPDTDFFKEKFYFLDFSTNPKDVIFKNEYHGSIKFDDACVLYFKPSETEANSCQINFLFCSPAILCVENNNGLKIYN